MSGYVEIYFDNSDKRFPIDSSEVVLRRNIGLKKDEYYLNNKNLSADDVMNLFESAGFSRSNPYNIVIQGQVQALTKMSPQERLELLKEVAGARVFDNKKKESEKILEETKPKLERIEEILEMLNERLNDLEKEKDELKIYQQLDRDRRALEYTMKEIELKETMEKLSYIDKDRSDEANKSSGLFNELINLQEEIKTREKELKRMNTFISNLQKEREVLSDEKNEYIRLSARLELDIHDYEQSITKDSSRRKELGQELVELMKSINSTKLTLEKDYTPRYLEALNEEQKLSEAIMTNERKSQDLCSKQGRISQFKSQKERDNYINQEIRSMTNAINAKKEQIKSLEDDIRRIEGEIEQNSTEVETKNKGIDELSGKMDSVNQEYNKTKSLRDEFADRRKELWRREREIDDHILNFQNEIAKMERQLESSIPRDLSTGLNSLKRIIETKKLENKVFGPLIDLFEVQDDYITSIEVTAGLSLFHIVVDTDETASKILDEINREKGGRITILPLNRIKVKEQNYPKTTTAQPITEILEYDHSRFDKAFQQVFGKTLLCSSLEAGSSIAKTHNVSCVTLDGDQVNNKGALTGGFYDRRTSKIKCMKGLNILREKIKKLEEEAKATKQNIQEVDQRITQIMNDLSKLEIEKVREQNMFQLFLTKARESQNKLNSNKDLLQRRNQALKEQTTLLNQLEMTMKSLESELGTKLLSSLTNAEEEELNQLYEVLESQNQELIGLTQKRTSLEIEKNKLEIQLKDNLLRRQEEIENELTKLKFGDYEGASNQQSSDYKRYQKLIEDVDNRVINLNQELEANTLSIQSLDEELSKLKKQEASKSKRIREESKRMEKILNERSTLYAKKEELMKRREIGSLPSESIEKFKDKSFSECASILKETKQKLSKYPEVNKKALDQYISFAEERDKFLERKQKIDEERKSISILIETLDMQKDEAIERTFKGVSNYFEEVFKELTGGGKASLVMQLKDVHTEKGPRIRQYRGIDIKVSFTGGKTEQINQLSGGQQSLVALSLIFAIQRCDPAPFYVFDEIDPALDDRHRSAVGRMIQKQSETVQFIVTTHRPELIYVADKCYRIVFENKVSNIVSIDREEALSIVRTKEDDDEDLIGDQESEGEMTEGQETHELSEGGDQSEEESEEPETRKRKRRS